MYKSTVISYFNTNAALAQALNITPGSISQWGKVIPEKRALLLDMLTDGKLKYDPALYSGKANTVPEITNTG